MILGRIINGVIAAAVAAAAAGVVVVAAVFAIYGLLFGYVGAAAASAIIVGIVAVVLAAGGLVMLDKAKSSKAPVHGREQETPPAEDGGLRSRLFDLGRDRPVLAAAAAVAAGLIAWRNPRLVGVVLRVFEPKGERA